jgi:hypothetical protein
MHAGRMVLLRTVPSSFHARVLAARLGADGIVTQLRGPGEGPYPMGDVRVYVRDEDLEVARELLLADEVEAAFEEGPNHPPATRLSAAWFALFVLLLLALALTTRIV